MLFSYNLIEEEYFMHVCFTVADVVMQPYDSQLTNEQLYELTIFSNIQCLFLLIKFSDQYNFLCSWCDDVDIMKCCNEVHYFEILYCTYILSD